MLRFSYNPICPEKQGSPSSQKIELKLCFELLPLRELGCEPIIECATVLFVCYMAKLVDDNIVNMSCRSLDQFLVENHPVGFLRVTAPALGHLPYCQPRHFPVVEQ